MLSHCLFFYVVGFAAPLAHSSASCNVPLGYHDRWHLHTTMLSRMVKHDQPDRAARPRGVSDAAGHLSRDGYPGKCLLWEQQARLDKATGGGMKRVERITGEAGQVDYLAAFTFYLHIRNLNWNEIWEY